VSAPNPSWYDLLGIAPDASTGEIRAAWKAGIAELEPTDRRFRLLNQAAEVLLEPEARAAYDEALAPEPAVVEPVPEDISPGLVTRASAPSSTTGGDVSPVTTTGKGVPAWLLAGLGILTAALIGACVWAAQTAPPTDEQVDEATADAQAAAERAIVAIVSYDYRSLDDDQAKAASYMTEDFQKDYESLFGVIRENAPETKTIISTDVVASSIVRSGDDRVQVFLFIDTPTTNAQSTEPEVYKNQVTVTMEQVGDEWLVDDLKTNLTGG
jgi:Mce-associated membrane protein